MDSMDGLFSSLLTLGGITVPARAKFIATTVVMTTYSSLTFGLLAGQIGAMIPATGPLVPFLSGCWIGYSFGVYQMWRHAKNRAFYCAEKYPKLLAHVMQTEFGVLIPQHLLLQQQRTNTETTTTTTTKTTIEETTTIAAAAAAATTSTDDTTTTTAEVATKNGDGWRYYYKYDQGNDPLSRWIHRGGIARISAAILAAQNCQGCIEDLESEQRQRIIDTNYKRTMEDDDEL